MWMLCVDFYSTFLVQHWLSVVGMPRRYADYLLGDGFTGINQLSTIGSFLLGASMLPSFWNMVSTARNAEMVLVDDPWGFGRSVE